MAQVKVFGRADVLRPLRSEVSDAIHASAVQGLGIPADKRYDCFFLMQAGHLVYPPGRS